MRVTCLHGGWLGSLPEAFRDELITALTPAQARALLYDWRFWARPNQLPPDGNWRVWLLLAGRGFGKTRTGAELIRDKKINLLLQTGTEKDADLGNLPRMIDLARNDDERKLLELFASPSTIGRSVLAPPGTPKERVAELRRAFMAMTQDPTFLSDLKKARLELSPLSGERLQAAVTSMGDVPDWLISRARRVSEAVGR